MKKYLLLLFTIMTYGSFNAQEYTARGVYKELDTGKYYSASVTYEKDRYGNPQMINYYIRGLNSLYTKNSGEFGPGSSAFSCGSYGCNENDTKYEYKVVTGCCGQIFFNL